MRVAAVRFPTPSLAHTDHCAVVVYTSLECRHSELSSFGRNSGLAMVAVKKPPTLKIAAKKPVAKVWVAGKAVPFKSLQKKPVAKKPVAKKPVAKPASKKPAAQKPAAKKPVAKKPVAKKPAAKLPAAKKAAAKKPAAKKPAAKKPLTNKPPPGNFVVRAAMHARPVTITPFDLPALTQMEVSFTRVHTVGTDLSF